MICKNCGCKIGFIEWMINKKFCDDCYLDKERIKRGDSIPEGMDF